MRVSSSSHAHGVHCALLDLRGVLSHLKVKSISCKIFKLRTMILIIAYLAGSGESLPGMESGGHSFWQGSVRLKTILYHPNRYPLACIAPCEIIISPGSMHNSDGESQLVVRSEPQIDCLNLACTATELVPGQGKKRRVEIL